MKRIPQLDGVRGIAVLMVFVYHAFHIPLLWCGVDLFFVLSGYLITGVLLRLKARRESEGYWSAFYFRRVLRIAPPYLGFLFVLSILFPIPWRHIWYWYAFFGANLGTALGKCNVHAMVPLWSLAMEEQFYFLWPCAVLLCSAKTLRKIAIGIIIAAPLLRAAFTPVFSSRGFIYFLTPFRADLLACGALIAICAHLDPEWIQHWRTRALLTSLSAGVVLAGLSAFRSFRLDANTEFFNTLGYSLIVLVFGGGLVWVLSLGDGFLRNLLTSRPLCAMGTISYTFYLYQVAVLDKLSQYFHSHLEVVIVGFVVTFVFSTVSWHLFESQILKLKMKSLTLPRVSAA